MNDLDMEIRPLSGALSARSGALEGMYDQAEQSSVVAIREYGENSAAATASDPSTLRYDSFRYVYKPDYGRIVLLDQDPMTGEPISQIPSQRVLELYAEQRRNEAKSSVHDATEPAASVASKRRMTSSQATAVTPATTPGNAHMAFAQASVANSATAKPVNITI